MKMKDSKLYKRSFDATDQLIILGVLYLKNKIVYRTPQYVEEVVQSMEDMIDDPEYIGIIMDRTGSKIYEKKFMELLQDQAELIALLKFFPDQKGNAIEVTLCHWVVVAMSRYKDRTPKWLRRIIFR